MPRPVQAGGAPGEVTLAEGQQPDTLTRQTRGSQDAPPSRQSAALLRQGPSPRRTCPVRHGTRRGRHGPARRAGRAAQSVRSAAPLQRRPMPVSGSRSPDDSCPGPGRLGRGSWCRERVQDDIAVGRGERKGALGRGDGLVVRDPQGELRQKTRRVPADAGRRGLPRGLRRRAGRQDRSSSPKGEAPDAGQPKIDGLLVRGALCSVDARGCSAPARNSPRPRGRPTAPRPSPPPAGRTPGPCPTPHPAGHGRPGVRPVRPAGRRRVLRGLRQCGHGAPAAAPGADCRRRLRG